MAMHLYFKLENWSDGARNRRTCLLVLPIELRNSSLVDLNYERNNSSQFQD